MVCWCIYAAVAAHVETQNAFLICTHAMEIMHTSVELDLFVQMYVICSMSVFMHWHSKLEV